MSNKVISLRCWSSYTTTKCISFFNYLNFGHIMNKSFQLASLAAGLILLATSCTQPKTTEAPVQVPHIIESSNIVGLWQQIQVKDSIDEETGITMTSQTPRSRYKCIMPDGTYFLLNVQQDEHSQIATKVLHYGTYTIQGDTMQVEHIESCADVPALNGHESYVRYNMPDVNTITLYYKFGVETGSPGSSEWNQELWKRVTMIAQ